MHPLRVQLRPRGGAGGRGRTPHRPGPGRQAASLVEGVRLREGAPARPLPERTRPADGAAPTPRRRQLRGHRLGDRHPRGRGAAGARCGTVTAASRSSITAAAGRGITSPAPTAPATRRALGSRWRSSALAQEKTGEFWVTDRMFGVPAMRSDFEHCDVAMFLGKNPWHSHSIPHARVTLKQIAADEARTLIVVDPRRTETAELADIHLQLRPGTDASLLAALLAILVEEGHVDQRLPRRSTRSAWSRCWRRSGRCRSPPTVRAPDWTRRWSAGPHGSSAGPARCASFEDLGVQMNRDSTLVSYLHKPPHRAHRELRAEGHRLRAHRPLTHRRGRLGAAEPGRGSADHRRARPVQRHRRGDPHRSPRPLPGHAGRGRQPRPLARRLEALPRGAPDARHGGGDRRGDERDRAAGGLRPPRGEPVREGRGHLLQLRLPRELLPPASPAPSAAARRAPRGGDPRPARARPRRHHRGRSGAAPRGRRRAGRRPTPRPSWPR